MADQLLQLIAGGLHRDGLEAIAREADRRIHTAPAAYGVLSFVAQHLANLQSDQGLPSAQHRPNEALANPMADLVQKVTGGSDPAAVLRALGQLVLAFRQVI